MLNHFRKWKETENWYSEEGDWRIALTKGKKWKWGVFYKGKSLKKSSGFTHIIEASEAALMAVNKLQEETKDEKGEKSKARSKTKGKREQEAKSRKSCQAQRA